MDLMGIWGYEGYVGLRITCRGMRDCGDMRDMRDGPPPRNRPGRAAVFWPRPPPQHEGRQMGAENNQRSKKKNAYFQFKLLIINDINQYFNIHLHLISFIIYNR